MTLSGWYFISVVHHRVYVCVRVCVFACVCHPATGINREMKRGGGEWKRGNIIKFNLKSVQVLFEFSWRNKILTNPALDHSLPLDSRPRYQQTKLESINVQSESSENWMTKELRRLFRWKKRKLLIGIKKKALSQNLSSENFFFINRDFLLSTIQCPLILESWSSIESSIFLNVSTIILKKKNYRRMENRSSHSFLFDIIIFLYLKQIDYLVMI